MDIHLAQSPPELGKNTACNALDDGRSGTDTKLDVSFPEEPSET